MFKITLTIEGSDGIITTIGRNFKSAEVNAMLCLNDKLVPNIKPYSLLFVILKNLFQR